MNDENIEKVNAYVLMCHAITWLWLIGLTLIILFKEK